MEARLHIRNDKFMVEFPDTPEGRNQALAFRKGHQEFRRRRIREVIQAYPSQIQVGKIYELT